MQRLEITQTYDYITDHYPKIRAVPYKDRSLTPAEEIVNPGIWIMSIYEKATELAKLSNFAYYMVYSKGVKTEEVERLNLEL